MTTLLAFALLTGLGESAAAAQDECVLRACVEECVPRERWRREVTWEAERQGLPAEHHRVWQVLTTGYPAWPLRRYLRGWAPDQRLWLATRGRVGEMPSPAQRVNLADVVRDVWGEMPDRVSGALADD